MTQPLPVLLRRAEEYLSGLTDPAGRTATRDDTRAELRDAHGDVLAEYLQWEDPRARPCYRNPPPRSPITPR